ncbi:DUF4157 domain-containing protein [Streptomyces sp. NPDC002588]|uniref:eCIS core domain-containing protein n=1 Tax=Streptomyces sp. NPDC002588 TaxID=3154419 RepID=UPI00331EDC3B
MHAQDNARQPEADSGRAPARPPARVGAPRPGLLALQCTAGNTAVVQLLRQAGHPGAQERHEHGPDCGHQEQPAVQRSAVHDVLHSGGRPLDDATRTDMEARLDADFSDVRIHDDSAARSSAAEVGARAFTSGNHIVIGEGGADRHTLAHELTHVVQQRQGPVAGTDNGAGLRISDPSDRFEREAESNAARVLRGEAPVQRRPSDRNPTAPGTAGTPSVQRMRATTEDEGPAPAPAPAKPEPAVAIVQPGYASGDQFAIAAMLIHDRTRHVYLTATPRESGAADRIRDFYVESGIEDARIHLVAADEKARNKVVEQYKQDFAHADGKEISATEARKNLISVGDATKYVGERFDDGMRGKVRAGWGMQEDRTAGHAKDEEIANWLAGKGVKTGGTVAILWSRFSGKKGEVHIEHDSSYLGMAQIIAGLSAVDTVVIVGDAGPKEKTRPKEEKKKYEVMADAYRREGEEDHRRKVEAGELKVPDFKANVVDLTEFWKDGEAKKWGGDSRTGQFLVFDFLHRTATTRHLGFRSGNLEAMALMGFNVMYMEEPHSVMGGSRMEAWHAADGTRTGADGMAPGYERLLVSSPPTRSGNYQKSLPLKEQKGDQKHADWHRADKEQYRHLKRAGQDPNGSFLPRGFADEDLANIDAYLVHGDAGQGLAPELVEQVKNIASTCGPAAEELTKAGEAAEKATDACLAVAQDPQKSTAAARRRDQAIAAENAAIARCRPVVDGEAQRFRNLCARYGTLDALRARNLHAQKVAHLLLPS